MIYSNKARDFLVRHGMEPERIDPDAWIGPMLDEMRSGLAGGPCSMDMIPTYLSNDGTLEQGKYAAVIDAGGTNFRCALVRFGAQGPELLDLSKCRMPGIERP